MRPSPEVWAVIEETCSDECSTPCRRHLTAKQLEAFKLSQSGWGLNRMSMHLGITKGAVYGRLQGAHLKLHKAGVRQDEFGTWTVSGKVAA